MKAIKSVENIPQQLEQGSLTHNPGILLHYHQQQKLLAKEKTEKELIEILYQLFKGYPIKEISSTEITLISGEKFDWRPSKTIPSENDALNNPCLIEQFLCIYVPGPNWQSDLHHNWHAGRIRHMDFFRAVYGKDESTVRENVVKIEWLEKSFKDQTIAVNKAVKEKFQAVSNELESLSEEIKKTYLQEISGTFNWRNIAGTSRLSAHSFGMTLDLDCRGCEYWLWDYQKSHTGLATPSEEQIKSEALPEWRNSVPWKIVEIFEKHGFMWGGKGRKFDTMHFEYRPECFIDFKVKLRAIELLEKMGYKLLEPLHYEISHNHAHTVHTKNVL